MDIEFCQRINTLCQSCPGSWESADRTSLHNTSLGGAKKSLHLQGKAIDLIYDSFTLLVAAAKVAKSQGFMGIELDMTNLHLHLDDRETIPWHRARYVEDNVLKNIELDEYLTLYDGGYILHV